MQGFDIPLYDEDGFVNTNLSKGQLSTREMRAMWDKQSRGMTRKEAEDYHMSMSRNRDEELDVIIPLYFGGLEGIDYENEWLDRMFAYASYLTHGESYLLREFFAT